MDIEKLIEQLNDWNEKYISDLCGNRTIKCEEYCIKDDCLIVKAATALSTLQAENEKLRAELEQKEKYYEQMVDALAATESADLAQMTACVYYKPGGLCRYGGDDPANVCVLGPCDHDVSVQDVLTELEQVKAERDAIEQDFRDFTKQWWEGDSGFPCRWCKFENAGSCEWKVKCQSEEKICAGRAFEWRGPYKED